MKPYIQPFEQKLAIAELSALADYHPKLIFGSTDKSLKFEVYTDASSDYLIGRLAYWETVFDGTEHHTQQIRQEASLFNLKDGGLIDSTEDSNSSSTSARLPKRRLLRYGTHGIHEYRGKFFPQLVRALINLEKVEKKGLIADPMCGSGTSIVESILLGSNALGLDMNPLSVFMSETKSALLFVTPSDLEYWQHRLVNNLLRTRRRGIERSYFYSLPEIDQEYLSLWIPEQALDGLDSVMLSILEVDNPVIKSFMMLSLSNIIRSVSWQKDDDLRVRRETIEESKLKKIDAVSDFVVEVNKSSKVVVAFLKEIQNLKKGQFSIREGDARRSSTILAEYRGEVDAIITSPPYATALPYLDTDRLSLCYLGLLPRPEHRKRDSLMIGNREVSERERNAYWKNFENNRTNLPLSITNLIQKIYLLNQSNDVGFRRRNLPSLLSKYFLDMQEVLESVYELLRPGSSAYFVVGNNHTNAGGEKIEIQTPELLSDIATGLSFEVKNLVTMDLLASRDIFKKNAMSSEVIIKMRRPSEQF